MPGRIRITLRRSMCRLPSCALVIAAVLVAARAEAAPKLPVVADEALTSAERLLKGKTGDDRVLACLDAQPFLDIVERNAPTYAYAVHLRGECLFLTESWKDAQAALEKYVSLVPVEARKGPVAEKVAKAEERIRTCQERLGQKTSAPAEPAQPAPPAEETPAPTPAPAPFAEELPVTPPEPAAPPEPKEPLAKQVAVRAGYSPHVGVLGVGAELKLGLVGIALGTGGYPVAGGLSFGRTAGQSGLYVDVHAVWTGSSLFVERARSGLSLGATVGYDLRPLPWLSIKAGLGGAYLLAEKRVAIVADLAAGPVFSF